MIDARHVCHIVNNAKHELGLHYKTIDFLEGNLEPYLIKALQRQLSPRVFQYARERLVPINIMPRYIGKLSNIYQSGVIREVENGTDQDQDLLSWYETQTEANHTLHVANKMFNACGSTLIHPYADPLHGPKFRVIPNDRFIVYSDDKINPTKPTMVILIAGKDQDGKEIYWVYTKDEFRVVKSDESIDWAAMMVMGQDGSNSLGVLPFIYVNKSALRLCPVPDSDTIAMTEYVPIALSDLNLAAMFAAFSITHITNGSVENLTYAPNALWFLKSDDPEKDVQIGTLKPEVDYQEVLNLIQSEISLWLGSKGIKAAAIGNLTQDNYASGISKIIDEADTYDIRQEQTIFFSKAERELWDLVLHSMHPGWSSAGLVENRHQFSFGATTSTKFAIMPVGTMRQQLIQEQRDEYTAGFTTKSRAIAALNPQLNMAQVQELLAEIEAEKSPKVEMQGENNGSQMAEGEDRFDESDS